MTTVLATAVDWHRLRRRAWDVRENARVIGPTRVGCAVLTSVGTVVTGCNVEHRYRSHCVHAEVNALTTMVANARAGQDSVALAMVIAAERDSFTPCGSCLDWIFQLGSAGTLVAFSPTPQKIGHHIWRADELMPYYPS